MVVEIVISIANMHTCSERNFFWIVASTRSGLPWASTITRCLAFCSVAPHFPCGVRPAAKQLGSPARCEHFLLCVDLLHWVPGGSPVPDCPPSWCRPPHCARAKSPRRCGCWAESRFLRLADSPSLMMAS